MVYNVEEGFQGRVGEDRLGKDREEKVWKGMVSRLASGWEDREG